MHIPRRKSERLGLHALNKFNKLQKFVKQKDVPGTFPGLALGIARTTIVALFVEGSASYFFSAKASEITGGIILGAGTLLAVAVNGYSAYRRHQARKTLGHIL